MPDRAVTGLEGLLRPRHPQAQARYGSVASVGQVTQTDAEMVAQVSRVGEASWSWPPAGCNYRFRAASVVSGNPLLGLAFIAFKEW